MCSPGNTVQQGGQMESLREHNYGRQGLQLSIETERSMDTLFWFDSK